MRPVINTLFVIAAVANLAVASDKPDFSGNWKLDLEKSLFGAMPPPAAMTRTVEQKGPDIIVKQIITGPDMDVAFKYSTDGKETANSFMGTDFKSKAHWDGKALMIINDVDAGGAQVKSTNRWTLSDDGKIFTDVLSITSPDGNLEVTYVLVKQ
jgi:hypothetical protein